MKPRKPVRAALLLSLILIGALLVPALTLAGGGPVIVNTATVTADNQFTGNGQGATTISTAVIPGVPEPIPTLSEVGLVLLVVVLGGLGVVMMRRRSRSVH